MPKKKKPIRSAWLDAKFKNNPVQAYIDFIRTRIDQTWKEHLKELKEIMSAIEDPFLVNNIQSLKSEEGHLNPNKVEQALISLSTEINSELEKIISKHSILWWYLVEARLALFTTYSKNRGTIGLYRLTLRLAILKYGNPNPLDITIRDEQIYPTEIKTEDVFDLYRTDRLSFISYMITADLRNLGKGGQIKFIEGTAKYSWVHNEETDKAIEWMDERNTGGGSLLYSTGIFVNSELSDLKKTSSIDNPPFGTLVVPNIDHEIPWKKLPWNEVLNIDSDFSSNYLFLPFDFDALRNGIEPLSSFFEKKYGFNSLQLTQVLIIFAYRLHCHIKENNFNIYQISNRGNITALNLKLLIEDTVTFWKTFSKESAKFNSTPEERRRGVVEKIYNKFLFKVEDGKSREIINLTSRTPVPWLIELADKKIIMDLRNYVYGLNSIIHDAILECGENINNDLSNAFPEIVWSQIQISNNSKIQLYLPINKKIKITISGIQKERECDLSFFFEDVLFICECKARRSSIKKLTGETGAMKNSWKDSQKDLSQCISLMDFILDNQSLINNRIPVTVKYVVPLVVYPNVTWIPEKKTPYCIDSKIPRFITPDELRLALKNDLESFKNDPITRKFI